MNKVDIDQQLGSKRVCVSDELLVEFKALFLSVFKGGFLGSKTRLFQYKIAKKLNRFFSSHLSSFSKISIGNSNWGGNICKTNMVLNKRNFEGFFEK